MRKREGFGCLWLDGAPWSAVETPAANTGTIAAQAKLMQQQQNYRHSVDSGDYFLIEMMTNLPSLTTGSATKEKNDGNKWFQRRERREREGGSKSLGMSGSCWRHGLFLPGGFHHAPTSQQTVQSHIHKSWLAGQRSHFIRRPFCFNRYLLHSFGMVGQHSVFFFQELRTKSLALE